MLASKDGHYLLTHFKFGEHHLFVDFSEQGGYGPTKTVKLEEIGSEDFIPCPMQTTTNSGPEHKVGSFLRCHVDTEGATRVLVVSDENEIDNDEQIQIRAHLKSLSQQIYDEQAKEYLFQELKRSINYETIDPHGEDVKTPEFDQDECKNKASQCEGAMQQSPYNPNYATLQRQITSIADYPEGTTITTCNQVVIEVLEAIDLKASDLNGLSNPYAELALICRNKKKNLFTKAKLKRRTYYIERTVAPKWSNQSQVFVFDVPPDAATITRGYFIKVQIRSFGVLGRHVHLGTTEVHLRSLRNQQELVGWYPLVSRTGRNELEKSLSSRVHGSVKLRVQWIYTVPALLDYHLLVVSQVSLDSEMGGWGLAVFFL